MGGSGGTSVRERAGGEGVQGTLPRSSKDHRFSAPGSLSVTERLRNLDNVDAVRSSMAVLGRGAFLEILDGLGRRRKKSGRLLQAEGGMLGRDLDAMS